MAKAEASSGGGDEDLAVDSPRRRRLRGYLSDGPTPDLLAVPPDALTVDDLLAGDPPPPHDPPVSHDALPSHGDSPDSPRRQAPVNGADDDPGRSRWRGWLNRLTGHR